MSLQNVPEDIILHLLRLVIVTLPKRCSSVKLNLFCLIVTLVGGAVEKSSGLRGGGKERKRVK